MLQTSTHFLIIRTFFCFEEKKISKEEKIIVVDLNPTSYTSVYCHESESEKLHLGLNDFYFYFSSKYVNIKPN